MTQDSSKNLVILGGSYGGISTAHYLLKHVVPQLSNKTSYRVILISTSSQAICRPACPRALISDDMFPQDKLFVSVPQQFEQYPNDSFRFIQGTATELDHQDRHVTVSLKDSDAEKIEYHALVIATGTSTASPLLGLNSDSESLRATWNTFRAALPNAKHIVIAGGGPTGVETAGELGEYLNGRAGWFSSKLESPKVPITLVTAGSKILPVLRPAIAQKAEQFLAQVGVTVVKGSRVVTVSPAGAGTENALIANATVTLEDGTALEADLYIPATGAVPNTSFIHESLLTGSGLVETNVSTLRVDKAGPRVYAVGDVGSHARPAVHNILNTVPTLCSNIKRDLLIAEGTDESAVGIDRVFKEDTRETQLVPIGKSKGVGAAMGFQLPSLLVWLIKGRDYWLWTTGGLWDGKQWAKESYSPRAEPLDDTRQPIDKGESQTSSRSDLELPPLTTTTERKLLAKVDWHILPCLCILYLLAFLDRVNISNAAILGLKQDLNIVDGTKYNTALTIFFVPYIIFEIPSNILLKKLKPHVWLSGCMFMFGLVLLCQGLVQNWGGLMATRFFLGVFETGMFPGCFYLLGMWYTRSEAQKRFSFFFSSTTLAGAFGGLLASGIAKMDGMRGYSGWRWVFIIEGVLTSVVAIILFFFIADFPEDVKWLNEEERTYMRAKLAKDVGKAAHNVHLGKREVLGVFKDYKVFIGGFMYFGLIVPAYGYAYFAPTIISTYGYGTIKTQLYSIPPWAAAFGFSMVVAYCSDKLRHRFVFTLIPMAVAIVGFIMLLTIHNHTSAQYGALFLLTSGCYSAMPVIVCWFAMNLGGHHRRSVGTAWQVGFGNIGGIIATYSFVQKNGVTDYRTGYIICLSFICLAVLACVTYMVALRFENKKRDRAAVDPATIPEDEEEYLGDLAPTYRYTY
ncbi:unnamed protein product [Penicillium glandicola]